MGLTPRPRRRRAEGRGGAREGSGQPAVYRPKTTTRAFLPSADGAALLELVRERTRRSYSDICEHLLREHGDALTGVPAFSGRTRDVYPQRIRLTAQGEIILSRLCDRLDAGTNDVLEYLVTVYGTELSQAFGVAV